LAVACGLAALTAIDVRRAAAAVVVGASSATVQNSGDTAQICVFLQTGGEKVAGVQNDLTWDGNCAILANNSDCQVAGTHGKQLSGTLNPQGQDFSYRALILSFSDTNEMPDGPLYCCNFIGEADPGQCCNITSMATAASNSQGGTIPAMGNTAKLCTAASSDNQVARPPMGGGGPLSTSNEAPPAAGGSGSTSSAPQPAANSGASAPPPAQVLPGGGARVENPGGPAAPPIQAPITPGVPQVPAQPPAGAPAAVAPGAVAPGAAAPAAGAAPAAAVTVAAAPTGAPTKAAASPRPAETPTARAAAAAVTQAPAATKAAPTAAKAANSADPPAGAASNRGLLGCEVGGPAGGVPFLALGILALIGRAVVRRGRR
jgi:hypothetical protein